MQHGTCARCGASFPRTDSNRRRRICNACSPVPVSRKKPTIPCRACGKLMYDGKGVLPVGQATCRACRRIEAAPNQPPRCAIPRPCATCAVGFTPRLGAQLYCSERCRAWWKNRDPSKKRSNAKLKSTNLRPRFGPPRPAPATKLRWRQCDHCQRWFGRPGVARFCSERCRYLDDGVTPPGELGTRVCPHCGVESPPLRRQGPWACDPCKKRFRSEERRAAKARRRARLKQVEVEHFKHEEIFERDNWTCQLCGKPVDREAKAPHPRSPSIDHIIPLRWEGPHIRANVQCACFLCNSLKGDRIDEHVQLRLVG